MNREKLKRILYVEDDNDTAGRHDARDEWSDCT